MNEGHKALAILEQAVIDEQEQPDSNTKQQRLAGALRGCAQSQGTPSPQRSSASPWALEPAG